MKVVDVAQMRDLEAAAEKAGLPGPALMEIAGRAVADAIVGLYGSFAGQRVAVLVGPGNNGGDGLVAARWLADAGARPVVLSTGRKPGGDGKVDLLRERGVNVVDVGADWSCDHVRAALSGSILVLDALLGIGHARPLHGAMASLLTCAQVLGAPIVALDVPSGLDSDTGLADPGTPISAVTLTLGAVKRGLLIGDGPVFAGQVLPLDIGIPSRAAEALPFDALDGQRLKQHLPPRTVTGHKYSFGRVMVVAGSMRYLGAPVLSALGAARSGAGLVTLAAPKGVASAVAGRAPEITFVALPGPETHLTPEALEPLAAAWDGYDALVVGPGLGRAPATAELLLALLARAKSASAPSCVIDADALTLLGADRQWSTCLPKDSVLTPHAGEMARLRGEERIGIDRLAIAAESAASWRCNVVLKGAYTVVMAPTGRGAVCLSANPALATAGTGDVLAGVIAGLIAQGADPLAAAKGGAGLHTAAGELLRLRRGPGGGLASDLADLLPEAANRLRRGWEPRSIASARNMLNPRE